MRITLPFALVILALSRVAAAQFAGTEVSGIGAPPFYLTKGGGGVFEDLGSGIVYNIYRKVPGDDFRCLDPDLAAPSWAGDPADPLNTAWWYAVNGYDGIEENRHGSSVPIAQACHVPGPGCSPVAGRPPLRLELVASGFADPVHLASPPGDRRRMAVVEQAGTIRMIRDGAVLPVPFLDITSRVRFGGEQGLLSIAFHPDYANNRRFYVYYTAPRPGGGNGNVITVAEYLVSVADPDVADPAERIVFTCDHPARGNHDGGQVAFGPDDFLYIGTGDGGGAGDPDENGQDLRECLGKILRIDVDGRDTGLEYAIPPSNPFFGSLSARNEIWAYGLRNPWRFSFDRLTGDLYIADVGQGNWEEIDVQEEASTGGENYGWDEYEGNMHCFEGPCDPAGKTWPVTEYNHSGGNCSVTGGHVYRGCRLPGYHGTYFYADYCSGDSWSFEYDAASNSAVNVLDWTSAFNPPLLNPTSFGEDADGEVYIVSVDGRFTGGTGEGTIYRIAP